MKPHPLDTLRHFFRHLVLSDGRDLTTRQMAVFLAVYREPGPHTVRGLAADLGVAKPVITRALDRFHLLKLARRAIDPADRRSVLVMQTDAGRKFQLQVLAAYDTAADAAGHAATTKKGPTHVAA